MEPGEVMAFPARAWGAEYLEDTSHRAVVLDHYDREQLSIRRYLLFLGLDPESCREVVQDTFLKLHEHLLTGGDRTNLRAWLYRVAHNLARNSQTSSHSSRTEPLIDAAKNAFPAGASSAEEELLAKERIDCVNRALEQLSTAQRECLMLRSQGLKYREIAAILNLSTSTVGENIQRGLEKLKELL